MGICVVPLARRSRICSHFTAHFGFTDIHRSFPLEDWVIWDSNPIDWPILKSSLSVTVQKQQTSGSLGSVIHTALARFWLFGSRRPGSSKTSPPPPLPSRARASALFVWPNSVRFALTLEFGELFFGTDNCGSARFVLFGTCVDCVFLCCFEVCV